LPGARKLDVPYAFFAPWNIVQGMIHKLYGKVRKKGVVAGWRKRSRLPVKMFLKQNLLP
jgi:hypothetical protein